MTTMFPAIKASSLAQRTYALPGDFEGDLNVLAVPFQMWQQAQVDTWIPVLDDLERQVPGLRYYELPVLRSMNRASQWFIDEGMRGGIRDQATRARTITLYTDKPAFRQALDLPHEDQIYLLLVDRQGRVLWQATGPYRPEVAQSLVDAIGIAMAVA